MKKIAILTAMLLSLSGAARAESDYDSALLKLVMGKMAISWDCRNVIGGAFYQSARAYAVQRFTIQYGDSFAQDTVSMWERKLRAGARRGMEAGPGDEMRCMAALTMINNQLSTFGR